jgi:hypothetical protein
MWNNLPDEIIKNIMYNRKILTCGNHVAIYIQCRWRKYKTKILFYRFRLLRYLKDFKRWNPNINVFILRSKL